MRKLIICAMLLFFAMASFCQQTNSSQPLSHEAYLKKSRHQKTAAWFLFGAGALSASLGSVQVNPNSIVGGDNSRSRVFLIAGLAAIGASVPLFAASINNRKKAANVSVNQKFERATDVRQTVLAFHSYPALSLKFRF